MHKELTAQQRYSREYYLKNREKIKLATAQWGKDNPIRKSELYREWFRKNRIRSNATKRLWYKTNKDKIIARQRKWRSDNPDRHREIHLKSRIKNKHKFNARQKNRLHRDPNYKLSQNMRSRLHCALKGNKKLLNTIPLLGCSINDFWIYLESKFDPGMTRENYGSVWHVDHIIPCAIFDFSKIEHQKRCFHFSNLQPLSGIENLRKGAKLKTNQFQLL